MSVTTTNLVCDLSDLGWLQVSGQDAAKLLQGQLTCDVYEVSQQQTRLGALCNPKGRVLATFRLLLIDENYYLLLPRVMIEAVITILSKYAVFYKAKLRDVSAEYGCLGLSGPDSAVLLAQLSDVEIPPETIKRNLCVTRVPDTTQRFLLSASPKLLCLVPQGLYPAIQTDINAWKLLEITAGIPTIYPQTAGLFTPHQVNYHLVNGVSFTKGCYTGQEIIARTQHLGKVKQRLYRIELSCSYLLSPGTKLYSTDSRKEIATLIEVALVNTTTYQALVVATDLVGSLPVVVENQGKTTLTVLDLPYAVD